MAQDEEPQISPIQSNDESSTTRENAAGTSNQPNANDDSPETRPPLPTRPSNTRTLRPENQQPLPAPYHPHQPPYAYPQAVRPLPKQSQPYIATKLGLTVLSSVFSIIVIALSCTLLAFGDDGSAANILSWALPITVLAIIWNTAELITYCVRVRGSVQRGIHPGAHVGVHLCFCLAYVFALLLTAVAYMDAEYTIADCAERDDSDGYYSWSNYCDQYYGDLAYYRWNYLPMIRALLAMMALALVNHFILFVIACCDTHQRNRLKPAGMVMPIPSAAPGVPGMYYAATPQGMVPVSYCPYPPYPQYPVAPPHQAHLAPAQGQAAAPGMTETSRGKQPMQMYQSLHGFYAPTPMAPATAGAPRASPAPAPVSPVSAAPQTQQAEATSNTEPPAATGSSQNAAQS
ncbi:hypothetical protein F4780DRAFT_733993 [Xylariomycetidae sp. FL0641]|nr:hypothetical protein F4780DRAFT_733993 [Xylariomycetidae sp. FL0641]